MEARDSRLIEEAYSCCEACGVAMYSTRTAGNETKWLVVAKTGVSFVVDTYAQVSDMRQDVDVAYIRKIAFL